MVFSRICILVYFYEEIAVCYFIIFQKKKIILTYTNMTAACGRKSVKIQFISLVNYI